MKDVKRRDYKRALLDKAVIAGLNNAERRGLVKPCDIAMSVRVVIESFLDVRLPIGTVVDLDTLQAEEARQERVYQEYVDKTEGVL